MRRIEKEVRVGPFSLFCWLLFLVDLLPLARDSRQRLGQAEVQVYGLEHDETQAEPGSCGERVGLDRRDCAEPSAKSGTEGEGNREAGTNDGHCRASRGLVGDVGRHGGRELDVAFRESADDSAGDKGAEVDGGNPKEDGEYVSAHGHEESDSAAVSIGKGSNYWGCDGLEKTVGVGGCQIGKNRLSNRDCNRKG